jgi:DNA sulfur modification protein DndD
MWLEQIVLKDFRCFCGEYSMSFSTDPEKNVTLIHAENGLGKTTLLNAMLWCFYGITTSKFEKKGDLVNHDARTAGRQSAYVEVAFEHNSSRYRARRYAGPGVAGDRIFTIMRLDNGHSSNLPNPDTFINTVIPKTMATHFLFDGEHAEVFLGEENRSGIRKAVQDILGCNLIDTAIKDLDAASTYYRRQMPKTKASSSIEALSNEIDLLTNQIATASGAVEALKQDIGVISQQIADIDDKLRNSAAARELQSQRENVEREMRGARKRVTDAQDEVLKWLGDNGRFLVSTKLTGKTFDHLETQETKGRLPSPYNEEFVNDLLKMERCICGATLHPGSEEHMKVASLLKKAANHTLRSRLNAIRAIISQLKLERERAPGKLDAANKRQAEARADVSRLEAQEAEISQKLSGINFGEIAEREKRRNQLRSELSEKNQQIGSMNRRIETSEADKHAKERELKLLAAKDDDARIFVTRYNACEMLKARLEQELAEEEKSARGVLRASIDKVLNQTGRKNFRLNMTRDYGISLENDAGTQLAKSGGENQLLGLAFTAALVEFAKLREKAQDHRLLKGTVAPLVLDSPFGQLDETYGLATVKHVPEMAGQVILMVSSKQGSGGVVEALRARIGREYVLIRSNRGPRGTRPVEIRQFHGKDVETAVFDAPFDGTTILELA